MITIWLSVVALLGLAVGSFLNVVIHRVPRGESVVSPPSACPNCGKPIRARHNIPVLGWLILRGRCAACREPISARYPIVEAMTAVVFVAVAVRLFQLELLSALPAFLYFAAVGIALAVIDLDCKRLPTAIIAPSYAVLTAALAGSAWVQGDGWSLARAGIGAAALFAFYFLLVLIHPAGMGFGDVRLSGLLGGMLGYLSWSALAVGAFAGFLLGALAGVAMIVSRKGNRKTALPFGPFMIAGAMLAVFLADPIVDWYVGTLVG